MTVAQRFRDKHRSLRYSRRLFQHQIGGNVRSRSDFELIDPRHNESSGRTISREYLEGSRED